MKNKISRFMPIIVILAIIAATVYYFAYVAREGTTGLTASGTVEAVEVVIAPEIGGRIVEILADEGDQVTVGDVLVRFNDDMLSAQLAQTEAAFKQAQANYNLIAAGYSPEKRLAATAAAEMEVVNAQQALDALYDNLDAARADALQNIANARDAVRDAQRKYDNYQKSSPITDVEQAEANLALARDKLDKAIDDYEPYADKPETDLTRANYLSRKAQAQEEYDDAVRLLNNLTGTADEINVEQAAADLQAAQAALANAERYYEEMADGPHPDVLAQAEARLSNAQAQLALAESGASIEELAVAQAAVESAQAVVNVTLAQLEKFTISAPADGKVLYRAVEPGEVVQPGVPLLTLARLENLSITVYVPEDRYGEVSLGDEVAVTVDSFPDITFSATVTRIADQAEFTPRNVQTAEGRRSTVFAVELSVSDPDGKLKPGMPADVSFSE
ncbi:MAG: HlyD family efflux transporter periplasmic adaptor subunit [Chloroflexi bacterium]|nr:HlyD family efflux transporter periplasmic adaptor subunit [Chloroflexota bacterium]